MDLYSEAQSKDTHSKQTPGRDAAAIADQQLQLSGSSGAFGEGAVVRLADVHRHVQCALCHQLIASSLVLSCGHQYCGSCLFDWLSSKPSCPSCQVPLRAIPTRCIALDGVIEAFLPSLPQQDVASFKVRQEEGKSAANKVNKMFWWLQPSAVPGMPAAGGAGVFPGASCPSPTGVAPVPRPPSLSGSQQQQQQGHGQNRSLPPQGSSRRASQPGGVQPQLGFPPRHGGRSNSFSAGGAPPVGLGSQHPGMLPPQMAASLAAAGFGASSMHLPPGNTDLESAYLATAQKFGMDGLALPLLYQQQQWAMSQQLYGGHDLSAMDMTQSPQPGGYSADPSQLQQLLSGLFM